MRPIMFGCRSVTACRLNTENFTVPWQRKQYWFNFASRSASAGFVPDHCGAGPMARAMGGSARRWRRAVPSIFPGQHLVMFGLRQNGLCLGFHIESPHDIEGRFEFRAARIVVLRIEQDRQPLGLQRRKIVVQAVEPVVGVQVVHHRAPGCCSHDTRYSRWAQSYDCTPLGSKEVHWRRSWRRGSYAAGRLAITCHSRANRAHRRRSRGRPVSGFATVRGSASPGC